MPNVDAVILAGGRGTRLACRLPDTAKVLAPVKGRPFLDYVLEYLIGQGVFHIIVGVGHLQEQVISRYQSYTAALLRFSREDEPLGTGGAVRRALNLVESDPFFVLNGDSLCRIELSRLLATHRNRAAQATLALVRPDSRNDVGNVVLDYDSRVVAFAEKTGVEVIATDRLVNAGVYMFSKSVFAEVSAYTESLELDVLPRLVKSGTCYGVVTGGRLIDIGTPERYAEAQSLL